MKKVLIILTVVFAACTNHVKTDQHDNENLKQPNYTREILQLNNGNKWKADETTKMNVAAMMSIVNDSSFEDITKKAELLNYLQGKIDTLVKQCIMKGAEHDALHLWLENVLK